MEDGEIEQPRTPSAGLTPRPTFANLSFEPTGDSLPSSSPPGPFDFNSADYDSFGNNSLKNNSDSDPEDSEDQMPNIVYCGGQLVQWTSGSVWDSYAYQLHNDDSLPWNLIGFKGDQFIIIQARDACTGKLISDDEKHRKTCNDCFALLKSPNLHKFVDRASEEAKPHTPWKYLNRWQLEELLLKSKKETNHLKLKVRLIPFCYLHQNCEQRDS